MDKKEARNLANMITDPCRSKGTLAEYQRIVTRLNRADWRTYAADKKISAKTAKVYRAAWRLLIAQKIRKALRESDRADRSGDAGSKRLARKIIDEEVGKLTADLAAGDYVCSPDRTPHKTKSKRRSIKGLPEDWRAKLLRATQTKDYWQTCMVVLSGCRPEELRKGIDVVVRGDNLLITIAGAKTSVITDGGQETRTVLIDPCTILGEDGARIVEALGTEAHTITTVGRGWQQRMQRVARSIGATRVSAYSLRHAFAADLKASGIDPDEISLALGHAASEARQSYGQYQQGSRRGGGFKAVAATQPIRQKRPSESSRALAAQTSRHPDVVHRKPRMK